MVYDCRKISHNIQRLWIDVGNVRIRKDHFIIYGGPVITLKILDINTLNYADFKKIDVQMKPEDFLLV